MKILIILALFSFSTQSFAENCSGLLSALRYRSVQFEEVKLSDYRKLITKLENQSNFMRRLRMPPAPAITMRLERKLVKIEDSLLRGEYSIAHREFKTLFREFELEHTNIIQSTKALEYLQSHPSAGFEKLKQAGIAPGYVRFWQESVNIDRLKSYLQQFKHRSERYIGSYYYEYFSIRKRLEELLEHPSCDQNCKDNLERLTSSVGIDSEAERMRFAGLLEGVESANLEQIRQTVHSSPVATVQRLKVERNAEFLATLKHLALQTTFLNTLNKILLNTPYINRTKLTRLFSFIYDEQAKTLDFPKINNLLRMDDDPAKRLASLREYNSLTENDRLLVNLARRSDGLAKDLWSSAKEAASSSDEHFHKRMESAEVLARARGDLSAVHSSSVLSKLAAVALASGAIAYFSIEETLTPQDVIEFIEPHLEENEVLIDELINELETIKNVNREPGSVSGLSIWDQLLQVFKRLFSF